MKKLQDTPLTVEIKNKQLIIRIGIDTLAFADTARTKTVITNAKEYAKDAVSVLTNESEDGSTMLTEFLDKVAEEVYQYGSIGIDYKESEKFCHHCHSDKELKIVESDEPYHDRYLICEDCQSTFIYTEDK